jgi:cytochrome c oxidase assembly factor CtaG
VTGWDLLRTAWDFEPSIVAGSALLLCAYLVATRFRMAVTTLWFVTGVVVMLLALVSPLDELGDDYLFSAHMLQHILLDLVAPSLFVLGLPAWLARPMLRPSPIARAERILGHPVVAWFLGVGTLWIWHLPVLYDLTLQNESVHIFEHLTFLVTGTILWWPVFTRLDERRLAPLLSVAYLSLAALANGLLGIIFTISSTPFYVGYTQPRDDLGALSLIRNTWGLSQIEDQRLGGAFMWVIGSVIFLWAIMVLVARWLREPGVEDARGDTGAVPNSAPSG